MKKLILCIAAVAMMLPSCKKINEELDALGNRIDKLENEAIPSIDEQIAAINTTLSNLDAMDKELKSYIDHLTATASNLQEQINSVNTKIGEVKAELKGDIASTNSELKGEIATAKADVLAQLEALETELKTELAQINATIVTLQAKDTELEGKITELRTYVDTELGKTTDWVAATFATLEQYNALVSEVATIKEQIKAINESITNLETKLTTKINEDIATAVSTLSADIQQKVSEITTAYTNAVKTAKEEIIAAYTVAIQTAISNLDSSLKAWVGEQLANYYTIAQIDAKLAALSAEFEGKLSTQKIYLESLISSLSQTLTNKIASNGELIEGLRNSLTSLSAEVAKNAEAIADNAEKIAANATLISKNAQDIVANGNNIEANQEAITANAALIAENKQLIADVDAKIDGTSNAANTKAIADNAKAIANNAELIAQNSLAISNNAAVIAQNAADIAQLQQNLTTTKTEITEAYQKAISESIATNNGVIDTKIANEVATLNTRIDNEVATINNALNALTARVTTLENEVAAIKQQITKILSDIADMKEDIANLLARIQSVSYIPTYDDGKATVQHIGNLSLVTLDFEVSPKDAVVELAKVWQSAVSVKAVYTQTRAVSFIDMPIVEFETDAVNGIISITASGENLSQKFFDNTQEVSCRLAISDGNSSIVSCYIPMVAQELSNVILYTSTDGAIVTPYKTDIFGANIVSNTYENGKGLIVFDGNITKIGNYAFYKCNSLKSVAIPDSITSIEDRAFSSCSALTSISIPNSVTSIGNYAFEGCSSLTSVTIPNSVTKIGNCAFRDCRSLTTFSGKFASADNCCLIVDGALNSFAIGCEVAEYTIPDYVTSIIVYAFQGCSSLTSVTIPECLTKIGNYAFNNCSSLKSVYCKPALPPAIGSKTFYNNASECKIYVPASSVDTYKTASYWNDLASNIVGENFKPANNEIWYTSSDDAPIAFDSIYIFGVAIVSNTYDNDKGIIVFNDDVTSIKMYAFNNCSSLTSVTIPNSVTSIEGCAFYGCSSLTSVTIPDSVTEIGSAAFEGCSSLKSVYCKPTTPPMLYEDVDASGNQWYTQFPEGTNIYVPLPSVETYKHSSGWSEYNIIGF